MHVTIGWLTPGELPLQGPRYAKNPVEIQKVILWLATNLNLVAMLVAILKEQFHELAANVENMLYAKNPGEIQKSKLWSAAILNIAAMLAAILKKS